jgi:transcriptional regulator with XRE-family HTH domain
MPSANICGNRVKLVREKNGLQQVELAVALNVDFSLKLDQSDISEIERGVRSVKDFELDALAHVLKVDPAWLLRGDDSTGGLHGASGEKD